MPLWFKGIIEEHLATRNAAGLWDVSHMGRVEVSGREASPFLNYILTNDIRLLEDGRCVYTLLLNERGGILDDLLVYKISKEKFILVVNAATREKDISWMQEHGKNFSVNIDDVTSGTALIALQGPLSERILQHLVKTDLSILRRFQHAKMKICGVDAILSRTGYTGEDGFEINIQKCSVDEPENAESLWNHIIERGKMHGILPCGLGTRDTIRLEAGLCLYGQDMDESINPFEARLAWVINLDKENFLGKYALLDSMKNINQVRVGFEAIGEGIPRHGYVISFKDEEIGRVTSGTYSPLLAKGIGMGYVKPSLSSAGSMLRFTGRGTRREALIRAMPFYDKKLYGHLRKSTIK